MVGGAVPQLLAGHRLARETWRIRLDEKGADAAVARGGIARGEDDSQAGEIRVGDPDLLAV